MQMENTREIQLNDGGHVHSAAIIKTLPGLYKACPSLLGIMAQQQAQHCERTRDLEWSPFEQT